MTYLFEGEIMHRDSLGSVQAIRPGDVNWMIAGRGIAHSERTPRRRARAQGSALHGIQTWVALPDDARGDRRRVRPPRRGRAAALRARRRAAARDRGQRRTARSSPVRTLLADCSTSTRGSRPGATLDAARRARGARAVRRRRRGRGRAASVRRRPAASCFAPSAGSTLQRATARARDAARRRAARRRAPHLVELRLQLARAHRAGQARLARGPVRRRCPGDEQEFIPLPD